MKPDAIVAGRKLYRYGHPKNIQKTMRIVELQKVFGQLPESDEGRRRADLALDHFAHLVDGPSRMDVFLNEAADWMGPEERKQRKEAALGSIKTYDAVEIALLAGVTWAVRGKLNLKTIWAIDAPPEEQLKLLRKAKDRAYQRESRALLPPTPRPAKKATSPKVERQIAAIYAALPTEDWLSVTDVCKKLKTAKHTPFYGLSEKSLRRVVNRAIEADNGNLLRAEIRTSARPDLRASKRVARRSTLSPPEAIIMTSKTTMSGPAQPSNEQQYRSYVVSKLAEFTPATASDELPRWFNSPEEYALRAACRISKRDEFLKMANQRRNELLAQRDQERV